jgi:cob(I)alamin adenosyltransferase
LKIYTKTGDDGETGLFGGGRVSKDNLRVAAYGEVDEVNAALGLARALDPQEFADALLQRIQRDLFTIGAELATPDPDKLRKALARSGAAIAASDVTALEGAIDSQEARLEPLKNFILPGGTPKSATLHLARTVCRRAERAVVALARDEQVSPAILQYLNRLSDLLFVLARAANAHAGRPDVKW